MTICNTKILDFYQSENRNAKSTIIWACKEITRLMHDLKESEDNKDISNCLILIVDLLLLKEEQGDDYLLKKDNTEQIFDKEAYLKILRKEIIEKI